MPKDWESYKGELDIGFPSGGRHVDKEMCRITLHDAISRVVLFEIELSKVDFFDGITGRARRPCTFEINPSASKLVGAEKEVKTISIFVPQTRHMHDIEWKRAYGTDLKGAPITKDEVRALDDLDKALAPYEHDGWKGSLSDATNWHNVVRDEIPLGAAVQLRELAGFADEAEGDIRRVSFHRWMRDGKPVEV